MSGLIRNWGSLSCTGRAICCTHTQSVTLYRNTKVEIFQDHNLCYSLSNVATLLRKPCDCYQGRSRCLFLPFWLLQVRVDFFDRRNCKCAPKWELAAHMCACFHIYVRTARMAGRWRPIKCLIGCHQGQGPCEKAGGWVTAYTHVTTSDHAGCYVCVCVCENTHVYQYINICVYINMYLPIYTCIQTNHTTRSELGHTLCYSLANVQTLLRKLLPRSE